MASKNRWLIIVLPLLMTCSSPVKLSLIRNDESRSSMISVTKGHVLTGHVIHKQRTSDIMACAQLCLARLKCTSFNYENTRNGLCELNKKSLDGDMVVGKNMLSSKKGHSFSQLINLRVSIARYLRKHMLRRGTTLKQNNKKCFISVLKTSTSLHANVCSWGRSWSENHCNYPELQLSHGFDRDTVSKL